MVSYKRLFKLLIDLDMSKKDLAEKAGLSKKDAEAAVKAYLKIK